jgi:sugar phosphate isomerase/epimerase
VLARGGRGEAGVTHIDVDSFDPAVVRDVVDGHGLQISSLAYYPNNLHPDEEHRKEVNGHLLKVVDGPQKLRVEVVGTFAGNDRIGHLRRTSSGLPASGRRSSSSAASCWRGTPCGR